MATSSSALSTLRPDLAGTLMEYDLAMEDNGFIATRVAPVVDVGTTAGTFGRVPIEQLLRRADTNRAPGGGYNRGDFKLEPDTYATQEHGWEEVLDDKKRKMYANFFKAEVIHTRRAFDAVLREMEIRVASLVFNATTWTGADLTTAVTNEWDDAAAATPVTDVELAVRKVWAKSGVWPNSLVINRHVFRNLRMCQQVKDLIAASGAGSGITPDKINAQMLATVFNLQQVIVAGAAKNTANEEQTAAIANVWSDEYAMVCHIDNSDDFERPSLARTFHWSEDGSQIGGTVETYRDESVRADVYRVRNDTHEKVIYKELGHLLSNITT